MLSNKSRKRKNRKHHNPYAYGRGITRPFFGGVPSEGMPNLDLSSIKNRMSLFRTIARALTLTNQRSG